MTPLTSGFVLAAAITILVNTALAWAKDAYPALNNWMKSLTGHHWTTHGLIDLTLFVTLGMIFASTNAAASIKPGLLTRILIGSTVIASLGLGLWYVFF